jgi:hypothetical protein
MKIIYNKAKRYRSFRRFVRRWFSSLLKRQDCHCSGDVQKVIGMLREIDESIEIIAREIARWARSDK